MSAKRARPGFAGNSSHEYPTGMTRASSEPHPNGNPHFTVDPLIAKAIAQRIAKSFMAVDPPNAAFYDANYKSSKLQSTQNYNSGAALCSCFKISMSWLIMIPGRILRTDLV